MKQVFKYIDEKNALAILPVPQSSIQELEDMLAKVDPGQHRTKEGWVSELVSINKKNRHTKKS